MRPTLFIVLLLASVSFGQDAPPADPAARAAYQKYTQAVQQADEVARKAKLAAVKTYVAALTRAKDQAMKSSNLEAANESQALIDQANADAEELQRPAGANGAAVAPKPKVPTFQIEAAKTWQDTVEVKKGDKLVIRASGKWGYRPNAELFGPGGTKVSGVAEHFYLEARIGEGPLFRVNEGMTFEAENDGMLMMQMRDTAGFSPRLDNVGEVKVTVDVQPAQQAAQN